MPLNLKKLKKTKCLKTLTCGEVFKLIFLLFLKTNHDAPPQLPPMPCWFPPNFSVYTLPATPTAQKMKFSIIDFFSKCDHIWSHLLKLSVMENFIFCAVPREKPVPSDHLDSHCYCIPWHVNSFVGLCNLLLGSEKI